IVSVKRVTSYSKKNTCGEHIGSIFYAFDVPQDTPVGQKSGCRTCSRRSSVPCSVP
ncbi:hypothetical protein L9F63_015953, partial [Diploptera punctata]